MKTLLIIAALMPLTSLAQAVRAPPPSARAPSTPYASPGQTGHVEPQAHGLPGAGAPTVGQPGYGGPAVTRSSNWRPGGKVPALMAQDGARASIQELPGLLLGLRLPPLLALPEADAKQLINQCIGESLVYLQQLRQFRPGLLEKLNDAKGAQRRKCLAAHLYETCYHRAVDGTFHPPLKPLETVLKAKPFRGDAMGFRQEGAHQKPGDGWDRLEAEMELEELRERECTDAVLLDAAGRVILDVLAELATLRYAAND